jgi:hypothetical protein
VCMCICTDVRICICCLDVDNLLYIGTPKHLFRFDCVYEGTYACMYACVRLSTLLTSLILSFLFDSEMENKVSMHGSQKWLLTKSHVVLGLNKSCCGCYVQNIIIIYSLH